MDQHMRITYSSSVDRFRNVNSSFDSGILKVAYVGKNRNGSSISKNAFERSISTIYNCPVVCNYNRERDEIGSHDMEVVVKDGETRLINITQPVGVIPESAQYWWENVEDASGVHEYLCIEALIWKRQEAYEKIKENGITDESMEIKVISGHMEDDIYVIESFEFLAFCLLETAQPCYESASLEMFGMNEFKQKYSEMMEDFKESFKKVSASNEDDIHLQCSSKGGEMLLEQKMELLAKFGMTLDQLDFDIDPMTTQELETKLVEIKANLAGKENQVTTGAAGDAGNTFALSGEQFRDELIDALSKETTETVWGEMSRYMYCDYDPSTNEVYCYDVQDWKLYGFSYSMDGDKVLIDFATKKRKKFSIVDFDEGDLEYSFETAFKTVATASALHREGELNTQFESEKAELEKKYTSASEAMESMNSELSELRQYKQQKLSEERAADVDAVFSMFTDLNGIEAFETLRTDCSNLSIQEIEDKCYAIRGRNVPHTFSASKPKNIRTPASGGGIHNTEDEPYGGLFVEFPPVH